MTELEKQLAIHPPASEFFQAKAGGGAKQTKAREKKPFFIWVHCKRNRRTA